MKEWEFLSAFFYNLFNINRQLNVMGGKCLEWEVLHTLPTSVSSVPADFLLFATWSVGVLCSSLRQELGLFLELQQGSQTSLHVVRGYLGFHSMATRESVFIRVEVELGVLTTHGRKHGVPLECQ